MKKYVDGVLVDLTAEEILDFNQRLAEAPSKFDMALEDLRVNRNRLLKETDYLKKQIILLYQIKLYLIT